MRLLHLQTVFVENTKCKLNLALEKILSLAEAIIIPNYPFSGEKSKLKISERVEVLREFLLRQFYFGHKRSYEIIAIVNYEADKRMLIPIILYLLTRKIGVTEVTVRVIIRMPISKHIADQLISAGCSIERSYLSLIKACAWPEGKTVLLCLDQREFYEYHKPGVDAADTARAFSIKTISIQHGGSREDTIKGLASSASDIILVWGRKILHELVHKHAVASSRIRLVGNPLHDRILSLDRASTFSQLDQYFGGFQQRCYGKKVVLLATCLHFEYREFENEKEMYLTYLRHLYDSLDYSRMILIVKMHPTDDIVPNLYLELVPPQLSDSILIVSPDVPGLDVYALLDCCDLFITRASTVAEDALVMGKRVIAIDLMESGPSKHYKHLEEYELYETVYAAPKTALREAVLSSLCSDSKPQRSGRVEDDITYCLDGRSTERAASEIVTELFGEPSPHAF